MSDEFQPYLDSVIKSGERTRNVWYLLVLVLIATFFGEWNTREANVSTTRFVQMMDALVCIKDTKHAFTVSCNQAIQYATMRHHFAETFFSTNPPSKEVADVLTQVLQKRVEDFMRRELEVHAVTIPILGVTIDGNDLWILSSVVMIFLLRVLWACLEREFDNMKRARRRVVTEDDKELIVMSQLFASRLNRYHPLAMVLFIPVLINVNDLITDFQTYEAGMLLDGLVWHVFKTGVHVFFTVIVGILCWRCFEAAREIEKLIGGLESKGGDEPPRPSIIDCIKKFFRRTVESDLPSSPTPASDTASPAV